MAYSTVATKADHPSACKYGSITGSDIAAGANTKVLSFSKDGFGRFSISTGTLTAMAFIISVSNDGVNYVDITNDLFSVATLVSDKFYFTDLVVPARYLKFTYTRSNATNAINFAYSIFKLDR